MMVAPRWGAAGMGKVPALAPAAVEGCSSGSAAAQVRTGDAAAPAPVTAAECDTGARWGSGHVRELRRTHGLIGCAATCCRAALAFKPILG
jgi:hypothetical protein